MSLHNPFLVLGIANGGLFMARQLRKEYPDAVIYAIGDPKDIGRHTNTIDRFFAASTEHEILSSIDKVIKLSNGEPIQAFMCSNPMLECLVIHKPETFKWLVFENSLDLYQRIVDKTTVDQWCRKLGIARPKEYSLKDQDLSSIGFPIVVKPLEKANTVGASKCAYLNNQEALMKYMSITDGLGIHREDLVCQQCVEGDNRWEYGYGGYFKEGVPLIDICFHQFIQVPQGLCCYSREVTNAELERQIKNLVKPFLEDSKYNGLMEFDIKQDVHSKQLYLLDINPRPWRSVDMLAGKLGDSTFFHPEALGCKVVWRYRYRELFRRKNNKNVSYADCKSLASGNMVTHFALCDKKDRKPARMQRKMDFKDLVRKLLK